VGFLAAVSSMAGIGFYVFSALGGWISSTLSVLIEFLVKMTIAILGFFSSLPRADVKTASPSWHLIFLYWIILYIAWEYVARRRLSRKGVIAALVFLNFAIWYKVLMPEPEWTLEFLDVGRNRAWLFSSQGKTLAAFDSFESLDDADKVIIPHLLNHHEGHLDYLLSSTMESQDVQKIISQFSPEAINLADTSLSALEGGAEVLDGARMLWDNRNPGAKVIWDESDNNHGRKRRLPALRIIVEDGELLLAGWTGMGVVGESWKRTILLELPWSVYAQSATLEQVEKLNPQFLVFSPDRYSVIAPVDRKRLTHSRDNLAATSICGAFMVGRFDDGIGIQTMRPWE
jgi:hypothetical protein